MCWITCQKWRTRPRIAKKKIEVWKVYIKRSFDSEELLVSPYQKERIFLSMRNRPLSIGHDLKVINSWEFLCDIKNWEIWKGYHSYKKGSLQLTQTRLADTIRFHHKNRYYFPIEYTSIKEFGNKYVAVKCYIPVGAEYYINEHGLYVSNKIIVGDIIPDEDLLQH